MKIKEKDLTNKDIYGTDNTAVQLIEQQYPKTTDEFKRLQKQQYELFCQKQMDYGPSNISVGTDLATKADVKLSLTGLWFRMNDKIQRIKNLLMTNQKVNNEPMEDSFLDVSNYGIMATIVKNGNGENKMNQLIQAATDTYQAQRTEALAHLDLLFNEATAIGEHTDLTAEVKKWTESLSQAEECLETLRNNFDVSKSK